MSLPKKVAVREGRGCSAPQWAEDGNLIAYTTLDLDVLLVTELGQALHKQPLYRVANAEGVGRRFVFDPDNAERLIYRRMAAALPNRPDRLLATPITSNENSMLTSNMLTIVGPYVVEGKVYYRSSLSDPFTDLAGAERLDGPFLQGQKLHVREAGGKEVWISPEGAEVEGFEWSPDAAWLAVVLRTGDSTSVKIVEVSGGRETELGLGRWPSWSGDSNRLVFVVDKPGLKFSELVVYDLQVGQQRSIQGLNQFWPDEPALDYSGALCAFVHDGEVFVTDVTGF